jgi:hypothetical protein
VRSANVSSDVLQIVKQNFPDGCYLAQVLEKYVEMYPDLTHKQARIKVDKSLRFQEKKGYLRSILDEGLKRRYSLAPSVPDETSKQAKPSEQLLNKYRQKSKEAHIKLASAKSQWEHLKSFQQIPEIQAFVDDLVIEAEQELNQLIGIDAAYEKLINKLESSCV